MTNGYYNLNEELIKFRRHGHNNSPANIKTTQSKIRDSEDYIRRLNLLVAKEELWNISNDNFEIIQKAKSFYADRIKFLSSKQIKGSFSFVKYYNFYPDLRSFLGDYYIKFFC